MTINNILEKVDLLNFIFDEDASNEKQKEAGTSKVVAPVKTVVMNASDPTCAYLGNLINNASTSQQMIITLIFYRT